MEAPTTILPGSASPPVASAPTAPQSIEPLSTEPGHDKRGPKREFRMSRVNATAAVALVAAVALLLAVLATVGLASTRHQLTKVQATATQAQRQQAADAANLAKLQADLTAVQGSLTKAVGGSINTGAVSAKVLKSVFTVEAGDALGTAFAVRRSASGGTILVTNYHVVAGVWSAGGRAVSLKQGSRSISGQIATVRPAKDLASIEVLPALPILALNTHEPAVGAPVLVVGSPLGLGGTVTTGVVSAHRSGLIQISAPISPGNSGGPVVDAQGRVVGIASEKIVADYAEGLAFAIPIQEVCTNLVSC